MADATEVSFSKTVLSELLKKSALQASEQLSVYTGRCIELDYQEVTSGGARNAQSDHLACEAQLGGKVGFSFHLHFEGRMQGMCLVRFSSPSFARFVAERLAGVENLDDEDVEEALAELTRMAAQTIGGALGQAFGAKVSIEEPLDAGLSPSRQELVHSTAENPVTPAYFRARFSYPEDGALELAFVGWPALGQAA